MKSLNSGNWHFRLINRKLLYEIFKFLRNLICKSHLVVKQKTSMSDVQIWRGMGPETTNHRRRPMDNLLDAMLGLMNYSAGNQALRMCPNQIAWLGQRHRLGWRGPSTLDAEKVVDGRKSGVRATRATCWPKLERICELLATWISVIRAKHVAGRWSE